MDNIPLSEFEIRAGRLLDQMERLFQASTTYSTVIVAAGYAGFFAAWATLAPDLPRGVVLLSGGTMLISLTLFITWEIAGMVQRSISAWHFAPLQDVTLPDWPTRWERAAQKARASGTWLKRGWIIMLVLQVSTGLSAAGYLAFSAFARVLDLAQA